MEQPKANERAEPDATSNKEEDEQTESAAAAHLRRRSCLCWEESVEAEPAIG